MERKYPNGTYIKVETWPKGGFCIYLSRIVDYWEEEQHDTDWKEPYYFGESYIVGPDHALSHPVPSVFDYFWFGKLQPLPSTVYDEIRIVMKQHAAEVMRLIRKEKLKKLGKPIVFKENSYFVHEDMHYHSLNKIWRLHQIDDSNESGVGIVYHAKGDEENFRIVSNAIYLEDGTVSPMVGSIDKSCMDMECDYPISAKTYEKAMDIYRDLYNYILQVAHTYVDF